MTNTAVLASGTNDYVTNSMGYRFVPKTPEIFLHDEDGNMTNDGRWSLTWDGENRLIKMESLAGAPAGSSNRLTFVYDHQGRRVSKAVQTFTNGAWSITLSNYFLYDGWNLAAELNATNKAVVNAFVWGLDLSGSMQGAGGVGGLLAVTTTNAGTHFVGFDGNGNVAVLVSATSGTATANYEYDPFGIVLRATGPMALLNPFRFSTKYTDGESGFNYYGYRYYNAAVGRWPNRDPVAERGGLNLYGFGGNSPVDKIDPFGLDYSWPVVPPPGYPPIFPYRPPQPKQCPDGNCNPFTISQRALAAQARHHNLALDPDPYGGGYRHCVAACMVARCYGGFGWAMTRIRNWLDETNNPQNPRYEDSRSDIESERTGERIALFIERFNADCEGACLQAYPPRQGPTIPTSPGAPR